MSDMLQLVVSQPNELQMINRGWEVQSWLVPSRQAKEQLAKFATRSHSPQASALGVGSPKFSRTVLTVYQRGRAWSAQG